MIKPILVSLCTVLISLTGFVSVAANEKTKRLTKSEEKHTTDVPRSPQKNVSLFCTVAEHELVIYSNYAVMGSITLSETQTNNIIYSTIDIIDEGCHIYLNGRVASGLTVTVIVGGSTYFVDL